MPRNHAKLSPFKEFLFLSPPAAKGDHATRQGGHA
jgi:hypothetical protein